MTAFLSLTDLFGLNLATYGNLGYAGESAVHALAQDGLPDADKVKLHLIVGHVESKMGTPEVAKRHFMLAFDQAHTAHMDAELIIAAGLGVLNALMIRRDIGRARHFLALLQTALDGNPTVTSIQQILLDAALQPIIVQLR